MSFEKYKRETSCPPVSTMRFAPWKGEARTQVNIYRVFDDVMNEILFHLYFIPESEK